MRTITIPIDLDTALALLEPNETLIELVATGPGVGITIGAVRLVEEAAKIADPPPPRPTPVAKKAPSAKPAPSQASNAGHTCSTCGRVFKTAQAKGVHQTRVHGRSMPAPVAAVPSLPPTPIGAASQPTEAPVAQRAATRPSSMCDRNDHAMCKNAQARCNCACHGPHGQQPPVGRAQETA